MKFSIVIPTRNRPGALTCCLNALVKQIKGRLDFEVHVIDDNSTIENRIKNEQVCSASGVSYSWNAKNISCAGTRNEGVRRSSGAWVIFLDDDVLPDSTWVDNVEKKLSGQPPGVIGVEGLVTASGTGIWDREVVNERGGRYLSCNIAYRKDVLENAGLFNDAFVFGPYAEDHELAARMLQMGSIQFSGEMKVVHQSRNIRPLQYIAGSFSRTKNQLSAEYLFYSIHPDRYHQFRNARTFWGTLVSMLLRHTLNEIRRKRIVDLLRHPVQSVTLICASLLEQLYAWILVPKFIADAKQRVFRFEKIIDTMQTGKLWNTDYAVLRKSLFVKRSLGRSLLFRYIKKPVYDGRRPIFQLSKSIGLQGGRVLIRIDDLFLKDRSAIEGVCKLFSDLKLPFLAGITGDDLKNPEYESLIGSVISSNGSIGLHGFSHQGRFGMFPSEILQMTIPELERNVTEVIDNCSHRDSISAFIPPFNAINMGQVEMLQKYFKTICGGPETARFTNACLGPVRLKQGSLYISSLQPFYGTANKMLTVGVVDFLSKTRGYVCVSFHLDAEYQNQFQALKIFLKQVYSSVISWDTVQAAI